MMPTLSLSRLVPDDGGALTACAGICSSRGSNMDKKNDMANGHQLKLKHHARSWGVCCMVAFVMSNQANVNQMR